MCDGLTAEARAQQAGPSNDPEIVQAGFAVPRGNILLGSERLPLPEYAGHDHFVGALGFTEPDESTVILFSYCPQHDEALVQGIFDDDSNLDEIFEAARRQHDAIVEEIEAQKAEFAEAPMNPALN